MGNKERATNPRFRSKLRVWRCSILLVCAFVLHVMWIELSANARSLHDHGTSIAFMNFILVPPMGKAVALPSVRVEKTSVESESIYGGIGDKPHLGGFTDLDHEGVSPAVWKWMVTYLGVQSVLDVGCGRGISTSWFYFHGVDVLCVEGSHHAVESTVLPDPGLIVEHDFSRGPWWPDKTYDAIWCVEFLEHVSTPKLRTLDSNCM
jgi:hypothetical protein